MKCGRGGLDSFCLLVALALSAAAVACGGGADSENAGRVDAATTAEPLLAVENARLMLMPEVAAVYLDIVNTGEGTDRLVSVETGAAAAAETHETVYDEGMTRMAPRPEGFDIPAGTTVHLEPGGKHIMLVDPRIGEEASTIDLTLLFERSGATEIEAVVERMGGSGGEHVEH